NAFGFSAIPSGLRIPAGSFNNLGIFTGFWSSTESSSTTSKSLFLNNVVMNNDIDHSVIKTFGFSIRCLKD
ncbi:MAG: FISUMP domain-containing protein, partial [Bacteroidia bacterium]